MKIFHVSTPDRLKEILQTGEIKTAPAAAVTYDDYGEEVDFWDDRAHFCKTAEGAAIVKSAFENYYQKPFEIAEFEVADDTEAIPDPNARGYGFFSRKNIPILK